MLLVGGFWFFQIAQHAKFKEMAENNHQRTLPLRAPRGVIFDRHGRVRRREPQLVQHLDPPRAQQGSRAHDRSCWRDVTGVPADEIRETVARHRHEPTYRPIVVINDATLAQIAAVMARRLDFELPDVVVQEVPTRQYPSESLAAHLIGYVGEASEEQVSDGGYSLGAIVGQTGRREDLQRAADGRRTARAASSSTARAARSASSTRSRRSKAAACS